MGTKILSFTLFLSKFVSSFEISFTDIGCVGLFGEVNYAVTPQDAESNQIGEVEMLGCAESSAGPNFSNNENSMALGNYQVSIEFTNGPSSSKLELSF